MGAAPDAGARIAHFREIAKHPHVDGTTATLWGDMNFPPWPEGLPGTVALLALMQEAERELGLALHGIPAHSPDEYIELPTLLERARINARFIELWAERFSPPRTG
jgi:hypothetical protein